MLEKKDVVQKSFRIYKQNDIWLGLLAIKLGRTQNELVNIAIKMLLDDNKRWFFDEFIRATFELDFHEKGPYEKKRLGDISVEILPYYDNTENQTYINIRHYKDDMSDSVVEESTVKVEFGPGYEARLVEALVDIFEETLRKYPNIMKDFNPGISIEET